MYEKKTFVKVFVRDKGLGRRILISYLSGVSIAELQSIYGVKRPSIYNQLRKFPEFCAPRITHQFYRNHQKKLKSPHYEMIGTKQGTRINNGKAYKEYLEDERRRKLSKLPCEQLILFLPKEELPDRCLVK